MARDTNPDVLGYQWDTSPGIPALGYQPRCLASIQVGAIPMPMCSCNQSSCCSIGKLISLYSSKSVLFKILSSLWFSYIRPWSLHQCLSKKRTKFYDLLRFSTSLRFLEFPKLFHWCFYTITVKTSWYKGHKLILYIYQ